MPAEGFHIILEKMLRTLLEKGILKTWKKN